MGLMDSLLKTINPTKKPGEFCISDCGINDIRCEACLAGQEKIRAAIIELQNLEIAFMNAENNPRAAEEYRITKCSLCGAPVEKAEQSCPYCGEPYPAGTITADIPTSRIEQDNMLLQKASEIYDMYASHKKRVYENKGKTADGKSSGLFGGAVHAMYAVSNKFVDMTPQEIRKLSQQNGVSYCDYVVGVMQGLYQSAGDIKMQQISQKLDEFSRESERYRAESRRIESERQAKVQQIRNESFERQMAFMASKSAPQYNGGGTTRCCGTCRYYGAGKCCATGGKFEGWNRNASDDTCGWYGMK